MARKTFQLSKLRPPWIIKYVSNFIPVFGVLKWKIFRLLRKSHEEKMQINLIYEVKLFMKNEFLYFYFKFHIAK